ncbi:hypothetical protein Tco_1460476, partial [Tanacetum coccineum]
MKESYSVQSPSEGGTKADVSAPEGTKILPADQSEADTSAHVSSYHIVFLKILLNKTAMEMIAGMERVERFVFQEHDFLRRWEGQGEYKK